MCAAVDYLYNSEQIPTEEICPASVAIDQLIERHDRLMRRSDVSSYALDIRDHIAMHPQAFSDDTLLTDYCDVGLADIREQALASIDAVLGIVPPDSIMSTAAPVSDQWWISLSPDGRIAAHVGKRLARLKTYQNAPLRRLPKWVLKDIDDTKRTLDLCERALAAARACLAAFDLKTTLAELLRCEISSEFYS